MNAITKVRLDADAEASPHPLADMKLIEDIKAVAATQPPRLQPVFDWLLEQAANLQPLPRYGKRLNLRGIAEQTGVGRRLLDSHAETLNPLFERFPTVSALEATRRDRLPGSDDVGTEVPTPVLVAALQAEIASTEGDDRRKLLSTLVEIATSDRKLPVWRGRANFRAVAEAAGIEEPAKFLAANPRLLPAWAAFFHLSEKQGSGDPDNPPKRVVAVAVRAFLASLTSGAKLPHQKGDPNQPSFMYVADLLNLDISGIKAGKSRIAILEHFDNFVGPSQQYEGRSPEERRARRTRRDEIVRFAKGLVDAGIPLPGTRRHPRQIDLPELVRLAGGGSVPLGDTYLNIKLSRLNPTIVPYHDRGGKPRNYAQFADGFAVHRRDRDTVAAGSKPATESKARKAVETFCTHIGKGLHDPIESDFEGADFDALVQEIKAGGVWGKQSTNWVTEIRAAQKWLQARAEVDLLGDDFATVLRSAVVNSDLPLDEIVAGTAVRTEYLTAWMRRDNLPAKESFGDLETIAERLGLERPRLVDLVPAVGDTNPKTRAPGGFPPFVYAFLPDDWRTKKPEQLAAMVKWIDENLCHVNSMFGATMREVAKARKAEVAREKDEEDEFGGTGPLEIEADGETEEALVKDEFERQLSQLPTRLADEMRLLIRHMTVDFPRKYARRGGTKWAMASTAPMRVRRLLGFFKWQTLPTQRGGLGRNADDLTLGDLIHVPLMFAYLDFKARSLAHVEHEGNKRGKVFTGTEVDLLSIAKALVSNEFGIVTQRTELAKRMVADDRPLEAGSYISLAGHVYAIDEDEDEDEEEEAEGAAIDDGKDEGAEDAVDAGEDTVAIMPAELCGLSPKKFVEACRKAELRYRAAAVDLDEEVDMIRDPMEPIAPILDDAQPMAIVLRQLALAERKSPSVDHLALQHHLHKRDVLMNRLLALTTLRSKNIREIRVDGSRPNLVYDEDKKQWLLKIHWRRFKNYRTCTLFGRKRKRQWYRKWLPNTHGLYELIEYYVGTSRPWFLARCTRGKPGKELFLTSRGHALKAEQVWKAVNRFTARHIAWNPFRKEGVPGVQPFGPHAYRDIRATNILLNPQTNNPYLEAAMALQTSTQMIVNHYGLVRVEKRTAADDIGYFKSEELAWAMINGSRGAG